MKIDFSKLPIDLDDLEEYGLSFELYDSGNLCWFGEIDGDVLTLEEFEESGKAIQPPPAGSGGTPDYTIYKDGHYENFNAFSDNSSAIKMGFEDWIWKEINKICEAALRAQQARDQARDLRRKKPILKIVK